uniref:Uncharacterized protein n=1 Tax=Anguilla anguilla TaxID=7936 RepID=A0A0E9V714_ANGAN
MPAVDYWSRDAETLSKYWSSLLSSWS